MLVKPSLPNLEEYEKYITKYITKYSELAESDINAANRFLTGAVLRLIGKFSYNEIIYIFQQVLITHFLSTSENVCEAAKKMGIKHSTFCMYRKRKHPSLLIKPYHTNYLPINWR